MKYRVAIEFYSQQLGKSISAQKDFNLSGSFCSDNIKFLVLGDYRDVNFIGVDLDDTENPIFISLQLAEICEQRNLELAEGAYEEIKDELIRDGWLV